MSLGSTLATAPGETDHAQFDDTPRLNGEQERREEGVVHRASASRRGGIYFIMHILGYICIRQLTHCTSFFYANQIYIMPAQHFVSSRRLSKAWSFSAAQAPEISITRITVSILTVGLMIAWLHPADATTRKVRIPNHYDGAWTIVATTASGPCKASTSYQVRIKDGDASTPSRAVDIAGGVSAGGAVRATIIKASNRAPITGNLDARGSGNGTCARPAAWSSAAGIGAPDVLDRHFVYYCP